MRSSLRLLLLVALSGVALMASGPASAAVDDSLVLRPADVPGLTTSGTGARVARAALGVAPPAALKGARASGAAYRAGSRRLDVGAFVLSSAARARTAFTRLTRGARRVPIGAGGTGAGRIRRTKAMTTAVVIVRVGTAVGAVRLRLPGRDATAASAGEAYARSLAVRLRRVLALTAWDRAIGSIAADGSITPRVALRAFAIAYGPVPGAPRPTGPRGTPESATLAMQMVARVWDRLTTAQRNAIDRRLGAPHDASSPRIARSSAQVLTPDPTFQAIADKYNAIYHAKIPGVPPVTINAYKASEDITTGGGGKAWADALPLNAAGQWGVGAPASCRVRVPPFGQAEVGKPFFELVMAHETFHCIQFVLMTAWRQRTAWVIEGMADWAAVTADPVAASVGAGPYKYYLKTPFATLFSRAYEASGFWGHIDEVSGAGSLWARIPAILAAADDPASYVAAGGTSPAFVGTWASAMFRYPGAGAPWFQTHPYAIPSSTYPGGVIDIGGDNNLTSPPYTIRSYEVLPRAKQPLVHVVQNSGEMRAGTPNADFGPVNSEWYCLGAKCKCPPKKVSTIPTNTKVNAKFLALGLSGGSEPGTGLVGYHSLDEFCKKKEEPHGPAETNGDPHLTSLDGLHFDFQAAGEFILARSRSGDLEIQSRQQGYKDSRTVTVNTQLAMRVAGHRVTVSPGATDDAPPVVRIDGTVDALPPETVRSFGAASVAREVQDGYVDVEWPDGSLVTVRPVGKWGVAARIELTDSRSGTMSGILGDFDGNAADDLADRKGRRISYTTVSTSTGWDGLTRFRAKQEFTGPFFDALYNRVGDSWRIRQSESILDYGPGQTTKTFDDRSIPTRPIDPDELARAKRAAAEKICRARGVTQPGPLADCITDIAATGDPVFADDALAAQDAALVSWTKLRAGADRSETMALLTTRDGVLHLGIQERIAGPAYRMVSVALDRSDRESAPELIDGIDGDLSLLPAPDATVRAVASKIPPVGPSGVFQYARSPGGAWTPLGPVTTQGTSYAGLPVSVFATDGTLLTISPMNGNARVFRGTGDPNLGFDPNPELPDCYSTSPSLARDGATGAIWAAWIQWDCPQQGAFVRQIDPATGKPLGPEIKAPGSSWVRNGTTTSPYISLNEAVPFTGRPGQPGVFLAFPADDRSRLRLWRVGDASSTVVPPRKDGLDDVRLTADPGTGRLWLAWVEADRLWVQPTGPTGTPTGVPRPAGPPRDAKPGFLSLHHWDIAARNGGLDILYGYVKDGDAPGGLWHARMLP